MKKLSGAFLLINFLVHCPPAHAQSNNPLINSGQLLQKASVLYDSGSYKKSIDIYQQIDINDSNYERALYGISLNYYADSQFNQTLHYLQTALAQTTDPEREPDLLNLYANTTDALGHTEQAIKMLDSAILKYPNHSLLYLNKGTFLLTKGRYTEAEAA